MNNPEFSITPTRRDRFVFQYPPFASMSESKYLDYLTQSTECSETKKGFQLYLHIPFCRVRCKYCYYSSVPSNFKKVLDAYLDSLHKEIDMVADLAYLQDREVETIYFGGGTPTYLNENQLESLVLHLKKRFHFAPSFEFTCESEPTTINENKLQLLKDLGVNRLSIGIQSFHPDIAKLNGRIANQESVKRVLGWAKKTGLRVMNIDLMSGMLGETKETWKYSIDNVLDYEVEHMTIYRMEIKPGTRLFANLQFDPDLCKKFVGDGLELQMIEYAEERFAEAGYIHHTHFSWVSKPEFKHTHRTNCWQCKDLVCLGASAFGYSNGFMYQNSNHYKPYIKTISEGRFPIVCSHKLSLREKMVGYMVMGFKLLNINYTAFRNLFGTDPLQIFSNEIRYLKECGAIEVTDSEIKVTYYGCLYADSFVKVFYSPEYLQMDEIAVITPPFDEMPKVKQSKLVNKAT